MKTEAKQSKGQQTRSQLVEVAFEQFTHNGFHGTSMRKIADEAGLALGGIYNHFASKDEIFNAVLLAYHPIFVIIPQLAAGQGRNGEDLLRDAAHRFYQAVQAQPGLLNLLFVELIECQGKHLAEFMKVLLPTALQFGQRLATSEDVVSDSSPAMIIRVFIGMLIGYILTDSILGRVESVAFSSGSLDDFLDLALHGLLKK
ncbi:MAG: TetR family transcriptional regulator [Caldilineaceae bacterium]